MSGTEALSDGFSIPDQRADHWAQAAIVGRAWAAVATRGEEAAQFNAAAVEALAEILPLEDFFACNLLNLGRHLVSAKHYMILRISAFNKWSRLWLDPGYPVS
jgi:hypothetical protein